MMSKAVWRTFLVIAGAVAVLGGAGYAKELYDRATLAADLKPVLGDLTPQGLIRRCGAPDGQVVHGLVFREISYQRSGTTIYFIRTGSADTDWAFTSFHAWFGRSKSRIDPRQVLKSMPCLDPGAAVPVN